MITAAWVALELIGVLLVGIAAVAGVFWWVSERRRE